MITKAIRSSAYHPFRPFLLILLHPQELDITATDLSKECLLDFLPRIPAIRWLSAGQLDGMTDTVLKVGQRQEKKIEKKLFLIQHLQFVIAALDGPWQPEGTPLT